MPNITLKVDEEVVRKVRKIAVDQDTTLTQMIRDYLQSVADGESRKKTRTIREIQRSFSELSRDMGRRTWKREDLYER
jgi:hypothetical protein